MKTEEATFKLAQEWHMLKINGWNASSFETCTSQKKGSKGDFIKMNL